MFSVQDFLFVAVSLANVFHDRKRVFMQWLPSVRHVVYTDKPVHSTRLNVHTFQYRQNNMTDRNINWMGRTVADRLIPFAIYEANLTFYGTFKWLFMVDDDTIFFPKVLQNTLSNVNHKLPLFLGKHVGWLHTSCQTAEQRRLNPLSCCRDWKRPCRTRWSPASDCTTPNFGIHAQSKEVCLPLRFPKEGVPNGTCRECFCPVTQRNDGSFRLDWVKGTASLVPAFGFPYGGVGMILSQGLLRKIPSDKWKGCAEKLQCGPSDFRTATCIQNTANIAMGEIDIHTPIWYTTNDYIKTSFETDFDYSSWPYAMHKIDPMITRMIFRVYKRKFKSIRHEYKTHVCDRMMNYIDAPSHQLWGRHIPWSFGNQDEVEEECVNALGNRSGWYQKHMSGGYVICNALVDTVVQNYTVKSGRHTFGATCWARNSSANLLFLKHVVHNT